MCRTGEPATHLNLIDILVARINLSKINFMSYTQICTYFLFDVYINRPTRPTRCQRRLPLDGKYEIAYCVYVCVEIIALCIVCMYITSAYMLQMSFFNSNLILFSITKASVRFSKRFLVPRTQSTLFAWRTKTIYSIGAEQQFPYYYFFLGSKIV